MNDFTKEELKSLRASVSETEINNSGLFGDKKRYEDSKKLYNKIKSMIDNYCEKQIFELMNIARILTLQREVSIELQRKTAELIYEIESQQSEELKEINNE